jgi:hypothetical protein
MLQVAVTSARVGRGYLVVVSYQETFSVAFRDAVSNATDLRRRIEDSGVLGVAIMRRRFEKVERTRGYRRLKNASSEMLVIRRDLCTGSFEATHFSGVRHDESLHISSLGFSTALVPT